MGCTTSKVESEATNKSEVHLVPPSRAIRENSPLLANMPGQKHAQSVSWRKGDLIGTGANGRVYLGLEESTGAIIAVKEVMFTKNV